MERDEKRHGDRELELARDSNRDTQRNTRAKVAKHVSTFGKSTTVGAELATKLSSLVVIK